MGLNYIVFCLPIFSDYASDEVVQSPSKRPRREKAVSAVAVKQEASCNDVTEVSVKVELPVDAIKVEPCLLVTDITSNAHSKPRKQKKPKAAGSKSKVEGEVTNDFMLILESAITCWLVDIFLAASNYLGAITITIIKLC